MGNLKIPKLTPHNYGTWSVKKWCELMNAEVSQYADGSFPKPIGDQVSQSEICDWETIDRKPLSLLRLGVDDKILYQIIKYNTSKETWDALKNLYEKVTEEDVYKNEYELIYLDPKSFDSIHDFIIKVNALRTKLNDFVSPIKDDRLIYLIQIKFPSEYSTFVSSFNTTKATLGDSYKKITFDDYAQLLEDKKDKLIKMGILKSSWV